MPAITIDVMITVRCLSQAWPAPTGLNLMSLTDLDYSAFLKEGWDK
jgi:hypothetical protein